MPLINHSVPNLIQGVSQQSDNVKFSGQCDEQENALSSIVEGLTKRPATRHVAKLLDEAIGANGFYHFFNRDDDEKFVFIHTGTKLRVFNLLNGDEGVIQHNDTDHTDGVNVSTQGSNSYLRSTNPRQDIKALSVGDTTFLANSSVPVVESTEKNPDVQGEALVFIKQGDYEKMYEADFGVTENQAQIQFTTVHKYVDDSS